MPSGLPRTRIPLPPAKLTSGHGDTLGQSGLCSSGQPGGSQCRGDQARLGPGEPGRRGCREHSRTGDLRAAGRGARLAGRLPPRRQEQSALPAMKPPLISSQNATGPLKGHLRSAEPVMQAEPRETWVLWLQQPPGKAGADVGGSPSGVLPGPGACAAGPHTPGALSAPSAGLGAQGSLHGNLRCRGTSSAPSIRVSDQRDFGGPGGEPGLHQGGILPPGRQQLETKSSGAGLASAAPIQVGMGAPAQGGWRLRAMCGLLYARAGTWEVWAAGRTAQRPPGPPGDGISARGHRV